jgi:hypothetical protein
LTRHCSKNFVALNGLTFPLNFILTISSKISGNILSFVKVGLQIQTLYMNIHRHESTAYFAICVLWSNKPFEEEKVVGVKEIHYTPNILLQQMHQVFTLRILSSDVGKVKDNWSRSCCGY